MKAILKLPLTVVKTRSDKNIPTSRYYLNIEKNAVHTQNYIVFFLLIKITRDIALQSKP